VRIGFSQQPSNTKFAGSEMIIPEKLDNWVSKVPLLLSFYGETWGRMMLKHVTNWELEGVA
jgi:hypothetical protein